MTGILLALIALLAIAVAVNLLLTFALIRRMAGLSASGPAEATLPAVGSAVRKFSVTTVAGNSFQPENLRSVNLTVVFMMTGCAPCHALLTDLGTRTLVQADPIFAFIAHHGAQGDDAVAGYLGQLPPGIDVAVISPTGDVARAFGVQSFPVVLRIGDGVLTAAGRSLDEVFAQAAVPVPSVAA